MIQLTNSLFKWSVAIVLLIIFSWTAPQNHSEAEDVYDFALKVEQGSFADQAGVNRVLALPVFGVSYKIAQTFGYSGRAFPLMIFINRFLAVVSLILFYRLLQLVYSRSSLPFGFRPLLSDFCSPPSSLHLLPAVLCLAFSYGFWRYANEAETYMLAGVVVLAAWCVALKQQWGWAILLSALGILVHLLNLIPLMLIIPLYYLLSSRDWKKAIFHGIATGLLVLVGYGFCFYILDWGSLGAQYHLTEAGFSFSNVGRSGVAFSQCIVSGNFLFGFEGFRDLLTQLFPSRMFGEEFYMADQMLGWIKWSGCVSLFLLLSVGVGLFVSRVRVVFLDEVSYIGKVPRPFYISCWVWLGLYMVAIIRTESGSPELWIPALIPFWLVVIPSLNQVTSKKKGVMGFVAVWVLVLMLFIHNLTAGLLPVMSQQSDYHEAKGQWVLEHATSDDLILTDYEPLMIFYLNYFTEARIVHSGAISLNEIKQDLGQRTGEAYAFNSFFIPMKSMAIRSPVVYEKMRLTGERLYPEFGKIVDDEFGGIYRFQPEPEL